MKRLAKNKSKSRQTYVCELRRVEPILHRFVLKDQLFGVLRYRVCNGYELLNIDGMPCEGLILELYSNYTSTCYQTQGWKRPNFQYRNPKGWLAVCSKGYVVGDKANASYETMALALWELCSYNIIRNKNVHLKIIKP